MSVRAVVAEVVLATVLAAGPDGDPGRRHDPLREPPLVLEVGEVVPAIGDTRSDYPLLRW